MQIHIVLLQKLGEKTLKSRERVRKAVQAHAKELERSVRRKKGERWEEKRIRANRQHQTKQIKSQGMEDECQGRKRSSPAFRCCAQGLKEEEGDETGTMVQRRHALPIPT